MSLRRAPVDSLTGPVVVSNRGPSSSVQLGNGWLRAGDGSAHLRRQSCCAAAGPKRGAALRGRPGPGWYVRPHDGPAMAGCVDGAFACDCHTFNLGPGQPIARPWPLVGVPRPTTRNAPFRAGPRTRSDGDRVMLCHGDASVAISCSRASGEARWARFMLHSTSNSVARSH